MTDSISALNLEPGQVVGGYTLVSRLGGGAMGTVWTVKDEAGQLFAMKILRDSLTEDTSDENSSEHREQVTARERLRREALALSRVRHPGVASIVDMELDDALAFIVTELIDGDNLREDVEKNGAYTGEDLELLTEKLSSAVEAVHQAGIIHRDIKPTNVMISATGPVLVDFGIAMGEGESHVTRTGLVMGTPGFIAPEVIEGAESDAATDWWSVASVLAFAATGKPVFGSKPIMAVLEREASGNADLSGLPVQTVSAFRSALNPDRTQRVNYRQLLQVIRQDALDASLGLAGSAADSHTGAHTGTLATGFPALDQDGSNGHPGTGAMRPFESSSGGAVGAGPRSASPRTFWEHDEADIAAANDTAVSDSTVAPDSTDDQPTSVISGIDAESTQTLEAPGTTRVMPQTDAEHTSVLPQNPSEPVPSPSLAPLSTPTPLQRLQQPEPARPAQLAQPASGDYFEFADAGPQGLPEQEVSASLPSAAPVVIPPRQIVQSQVRTRFGGTGKTLAIILVIPIVLMCSWLPVGGAIIALFLTWLAAARGYSIHSQIMRESKRGGGKKRIDGALNVMSAPWHLLRALLAIIPKAVLWALIYTLANLLTITLAGVPTVTSAITLFSHTFTFGMVAGAPQSLSGAVLAASAALAWLVTTALTSSPSPIATGFASAWASIRRGIARVRDSDKNQSSDTDAQVDAQIAENGMPLPTEQEGRASVNSHHSAAGVTLLILLIAFAIAAITLFLVAPSIDWSPILTW
jgi:serine/threonine protein kinase